MHLRENDIIKDKSKASRCTKYSVMSSASERSGKMNED